MWLEEKWHVDLSGQSAAAVDADGWAYAVDFPWLKMPPLPGMGRKCVPYPSIGGCLFLSTPRTNVLDLCLMPQWQSHISLHA